MQAFFIIYILIYNVFSGSDRSPPQYDTLQHMRKDPSDTVEVKEPAEGQYNTLSVVSIFPSTPQYRP